MNHAMRLVGVAGALLFAGSVLGFGVVLDGYSHQLHPAGLLGAAGIPRAMMFNVLAFVLPGALAAWLAWRLRATLPADAPFSARIGLQLVLLSALAFASQGVLPLDPRDLDAYATRLHASAWMLWWIAFVPGVLLLAMAALHTRQRRVMAFVVHLLAAVSVIGFALPAERWLGAGITQRLAFAAWFGWLVLAPAFAGDTRGRRMG
jgi:hypothetical membrane protein